MYTFFLIENLKGYLCCFSYMLICDIYNPVVIYNNNLNLMNGHLTMDNRISLPLVCPITDYRLPITDIAASN